MRRPAAAGWTALLLLAAPALRAADTPWLPPQMAQAAAAQLAQRRTQVGLVAEGDAAHALATARQDVATMAATLTELGEEGLARLAPRFPDLGLPAAGDPLLDLMARYNVCLSALYLRFLAPGLREDPDAARATTSGLTALTMAVVYLREPFVSRGGDPAAIEAHLTNPAMQPVLDALQTDPARLAAAETTCRPALEALLPGDGAAR